MLRGKESWISLFFRREILLCWVGDAVQQRPLDKRCGSMRKGAAARELARELFARFVIAGYSLLSPSQYLNSFRSRRLPKGAYVWYTAMDSRWWVGKGHWVDPAADNAYFIRFLNDPGPLKIRLDNYYAEVPTDRRGSWCLQRHDKGDISTAVLCKPDTAWDTDRT